MGAKMSNPMKLPFSPSKLLAKIEDILTQIQPYDAGQDRGAKTAVSNPRATVPIRAQGIGIERLREHAGQNWEIADSKRRPPHRRRKFCYIRVGDPQQRTLKGINQVPTACQEGGHARKDTWMKVSVWSPDWSQGTCQQEGVQVANFERHGHMVKGTCQ